MTKGKPKQTRPAAALVDTSELCKELVAMAGLLDDRRVAQKIYKAVRQLQLLDKAAAAVRPDGEITRES